MKHIGLVLSAAFLSIQASALELTSSDIKEGTPMSKTFEFQGFGCDGKNQSPALKWSGMPEGTKSFAITAYDPDAPTGSGWWHWVVTDIPASVMELERNAAANDKFVGKQHKNDYGVASFGGACPPEGHGMHRYQFTVWALPTEKLGTPPGASNAIVGYYLNNTAIDKAQLTATYVRQGRAGWYIRSIGRLAIQK